MISCWEKTFFIFFTSAIDQLHFLDCRYSNADDTWWSNSSCLSLQAGNFLLFFLISVYDATNLLNNKPSGWSTTSSEILYLKANKKRKISKGVKKISGLLTVFLFSFTFLFCFFFAKRRMYVLSCHHLSNDRFLPLRKFSDASAAQLLHANFKRISFKCYYILTKFN